MRPKTLDDFAGQKHLIGEGKPIRKMIENNNVFSMVFWGPPGVGKTTLALIIANSVNAEFIQLSAVSSGVKDVRAAIEKAEINQKHLSRKTILFIDEIHRFNKAQQDSLLHSVESGVITLIGATTENPSFEVISPLLSRCRVYVLEDLSEDELMLLAENALTKDAELKDLKIDIQDKKLLLQFSGGDARRLLNGLDLAIRSTPPDNNGIINITNDVLKEAYQKNYIRYDKDAEEHYNIISAFIKSIRGSDPDAAVYWLARMLKGGEEPKFIARRMVVLASEDIGNADPYGLTMATSAFTAIDYIGMPEAQLVLAQAATYLASAPKSNASYRAIMSAKEDVELTGELGVPLHLRNAPTKLMKSLDYGKEYKYSHDFEGHFTEQQYLPEELKDKVYYKPTGIGEEAKILERLKNWWKNKKR
ncbi:MAG TPA: replication-associated recombination protein A [Ignavibacteria bacterium]|nr:replication-associated recombination protein A [Ignavibacteria bacterium]HMQ99506.1 replication-associated recombination protein A [Ignavibacteria bacterium]